MSVAKRYTRALFETLRAGNGSSAASMERYRDELSQVAQAIQGSPEAKVALYGPIVSPKDKAEVVKRVAEKAKVSPIVAQFLVLLARKSRLALLPDVVRVFDEVVAEAEGAILGEVVSADPMADEDVGSLAESFGRKFGKKVRFKVKTDPALLAGMKVTVNGVTYDGSLKAQINRLRESFIH